MPNRQSKIEKTQLRELLCSRRRALQQKGELSERIWGNLRNLAAFQQAHTILTYLHLVEEVRTKQIVHWALKSGKRLVVPYCDKPGLGLFRLKCPTELLPGVYNVLEPTDDWKSRRDRCVLPEELDVIIVPGVGFDPQGGRIGYGKAYYDTFLKTVPDGVPTIGLAFECQVVDAIPLEPHDRRVDFLVTEEGVRDVRK